MNMKSIFGGLYVVTEWMMRLAVTNIVWLLFNLPILFFAVNLLLFDEPADIIFTLIMISLLAPFVFFPATSAMFAVIRRWVIGESHVKVVRTFWRFYRENYVRSLLIGLFLTSLWAIFFVDHYFFTVKVHQMFKYLFYGLSIYLMMFTVHIFSITVHFHLTFWETVKNAFGLTVKNPLLSLIITVINGLIVVASVTIATFLIPFFTGALIAFLSFLSFYFVSIYEKETDEEGNSAE